MGKRKRYAGKFKQEAFRLQESSGKSVLSGEVVNTSIFTTVLDGAFVDNTACVAASNGAQECTTATAPATDLPDTLPQTGENPFSALRLPLLLGLTVLTCYHWRRKQSA